MAVVDYMQPSALCGAEAAGVPAVAFVHTLFRDLSPIAMAADVDGTNAVRAELGLAAVARLEELVERAPLVLVPTLEALDRPDGVAPNVRYVGPLVEDAGPDEGWRSPGRPLVVVSMGTTPMGEAPLLQRVLDGLDGAAVTVLATLGPHLRAEDLRPPANATLTGYVRHAAVLPHADLCVNHAGLGSIGAALTYGVPLVCVPLGRDQPVNAEAVAAVGAAGCSPRCVRRRDPGRRPRRPRRRRLPPGRRPPGRRDPRPRRPHPSRRSGRVPLHLSPPARAVRPHPLSPKTHEEPRRVAAQ